MRDSCRSLRLPCVIAVPVLVDEIQEWPTAIPGFQLLKVLTSAVQCSIAVDRSACLVGIAGCTQRSTCFGVLYLAKTCFCRTLSAVYLVLVISNYLALDVLVPDLHRNPEFPLIFPCWVFTSPSTSSAHPEFQCARNSCLFLRLGKNRDFHS